MNTVFGEIAQLAERLAHKKEPMVLFETRKLMVRVHLSLSKICLN